MRRDPSFWLGKENDEAVTQRWHFWTGLPPVALLFGSVLLGYVTFPHLRNPVLDVLGNLLLAVPRIRWDVSNFLDAGGTAYAEKCLFMYETLFVGLVLCSAHFGWVGFTLAKRINTVRLGEFSRVFLIEILLFLLLLTAYFLTDFSMYGESTSEVSGNSRGLPRNASIFLFNAAVVYLLLSGFHTTCLYLWAWFRKRHPRAADLLRAST